MEDAAPRFAEKHHRARKPKLTVRELPGVIEPSSEREDGKPLSEECVDALQRLLSNSENTLSSIVSTFNAPLVIFADAVVDAATSADDFRLEDVRRRRMSIYVRIPPNRLANARPLLNLLFSQLVSLIDSATMLLNIDDAPSCVGDGSNRHEIAVARSAA